MVSSAIVSKRTPSIVGRDAFTPPPSSHFGPSLFSSPSPSGHDGTPPISDFSFGLAKQPLRSPWATATTITKPSPAPYGRGYTPPPWSQYHTGHDYSDEDEDEDDPSQLIVDAPSPHTAATAENKAAHEDDDNDDKQHRPANPAATIWSLLNAFWTATQASLGGDAAQLAAKLEAVSARLASSLGFGLPPFLLTMHFLTNLQAELAPAVRRLQDVHGAALWRGEIPFARVRDEVVAAQARLAAERWAREVDEAARDELRRAESAFAPDAEKVVASERVQEPPYAVVRSVEPRDDLPPTVADGKDDSAEDLQRPKLKLEVKDTDDELSSLASFVEEDEGQENPSKPKRPSAIGLQPPPPPPPPATPPRASRPAEELCRVSETPVAARQETDCVVNKALLHHDSTVPLPARASTVDEPASPTPSVSSKFSSSLPSPPPPSTPPSALPQVMTARRPPTPTRSASLPRPSRDGDDAYSDIESTAAAVRRARRRPKERAEQSEKRKKRQDKSQSRGHNASAAATAKGRRTAATSSSGTVSAKKPRAKKAFGPVRDGKFCHRCARWNHDSEWHCPWNPSVARDESGVLMDVAFTRTPTVQYMLDRETGVRKAGEEAGEVEEEEEEKKKKRRKMGRSE